MSDYERIAEAIDYIFSCLHCQPSLNEIAAHVHLSPFHFQRLFSRWAGVTPKRFLQVLTLERAKQLLKEAKPVLEVSDALGLSSGSRLYDHFVQLEAVTPGEYKSGGDGMVLEYGVHDTPFGAAFVATTPRGVCGFEFLDSPDIGSLLEKTRSRWPHALLRKNDGRVPAILRAIFEGADALDRPLSLHVSGTNFQVSVWKALLRIPPATVVSYAQVARAIGRPSSARAVGQAVGANPVAFLIPCHRVIQQCGKLGGYHWSETRKHAMHVWELARYAATAS